MQIYLFSGNGSDPNITKIWHYFNVKGTTVAYKVFSQQKLQIPYSLKGI